VVNAGSDKYSSLSSFGYTFANNEIIDNIEFYGEASVNSVLTILFYNSGSDTAKINQLSGKKFVNMYSEVTLNPEKYATMTIKVLSLGNNWITPSSCADLPIAKSKYIVTIDVQQ
jgi:hypothetical protein